MRVRLTILLVFLIAVCGTSSAQTCPKGTGFEPCVGKLYAAVCKTSCDAKDWRQQWAALQTYCAADNSAECMEWKALEAGMLALDHRSGDWSARGAVKARTKFDVNGKPEVALERKGRFLVVVENTNPLLFGVDLGEATREPAAKIKELQELATTVGGLLTQRLELRTKIRQAEVSGVSGDVVDELIKKDNDLDVALSKVQCVVERTDRQTRHIVTFLQATETGAAAVYDPTPSHCESTENCPGNVCKVGMACDNNRCVDVYGLEYTNRVISELEDAVEAQCGAVAALGTVLTKIGAEDFASAKRAYFDAIVRADCLPLRSRTDANVPSTSEKIETVIAGLPDIPVAKKADADAEEAVTKAKKAVATAKPRDKRQRQQELATAEANRELAKERLDEENARADSLKMQGELLVASGETFKAAGEILTKTGALVNSVHQVLEFNALLNDHALRGAPGSSIKSSDVATFLVVPKVPDSVAWAEEEEHPFKVVKTSPFAEDVKSSKAASIDTSYKVTPLSSRAWDVGVSVVRTRVADPTFEAVGPEDGERTIKITDKKTRSGELGLFLHLGAGLVFPDIHDYFRTAGIEIGAAVSTDSPAFYAGLSMPLGRYLRLGWGYTAQRVNQLDGQIVGSKLQAGEVLETRKGFEDGHYISLSVSIGAVKLFTKD